MKREKYAKQGPAERLPKAGAIMLALLILFAVLLGGREGTVAAVDAAAVDAAAVDAAAADAAAAEAVDTACIALTFDDGPYPKVTEHILDVLEKHSVSATFFVLGSRVAGREALLLRMEEMGCEIGNHTFSHADLTKLSREQIEKEIADTNAEFERVLGHGAAVVRPPYGYYNESVRNVIAYPLILWTVDTNDWRPRNADELASAVVKEAQAGSVILMHDQQESTAAAMDAIIPALLARGFRFVTVSELLTIKGEACSAIKIPEGG
ncbi:MAG: hypothetical protein E7330_06925 [Clostridiales bacterium]|nr:hypothetical protein [Clostridiales bacterium]